MCNQKASIFSYPHASGHFGIERENLRVDHHGRLAMTPHPDALGNKQTNPEITTDFSESQVELVTPVASSLQETLSHMQRLTRTVYSGIGDELLWPLSTPPNHLPPDDQIPIADFGPGGKEKTAYRFYLSKKYGRKRQLYCGIHLNYSFPDDLMGDASQRGFFYVQVAASALRHRFFLVHLLAASPEKIDGVCYQSARLSVHGYKNIRPIYLDYSSPSAYQQSMKKAVAQGLVEGPRELYQLVRIKGKGFEDLEQIPEAGRIELRIADLNPFFPAGINPSDLYLMHLYLLWCAQNRISDFTVEQQKEADAWATEAAQTCFSDAFRNRMNQMFAALHRFLHQSRLPQVYDQALTQAQSRWSEPKLSYAARIKAACAESPNSAMQWATSQKEQNLGSSAQRNPYAP